MGLNYQADIIKKDQVFTYVQNDASARFQLFQHQVPEGAQIKVYFEVIDGSKPSTPMIAKVQSMIRRLALYTGARFSETKELIKERSGLHIAGIGYKSFGDCTSEELELCIQELRKVAILLEYPLD